MTKDDKQTFALALGVAFAARLPMVNAGLGLDSDAWRVWLAGGRIAALHRYTASRPPGNPLVEGAFALMHAMGLSAPVFSNLCSAVLSLVAASFLGLAARELGVRHWILTALCLAMAPLFLEQSVCSMDYVWATAFAMVSLYAICRGHTLLAGLLLGCAVGCRITTGALIAPYSLLILSRAPRQERTKTLTPFVIATLTLAIAFFTPAFFVYGRAFLSHGDDPFPKPSVVVYRGSAAVWGELGVLAMAVVLFRGSFGLRDPGRRRDVVNTQLVVWLSVIALYYIAFLRLPSEPGYLVVTMPFVLLSLSALSLTPRDYSLCCVAIILASFSPHLDRRTVIWTPRILDDYRERLRNEADMERAIAFARDLPGPLVIACNDAFPRIAVHLWRDGAVRGEIYEEYLPDHEADRFVWTDGRDGTQIRFANHIRPSAVRGYLEKRFKLYYMASSIQSEVGWPNPIEGGRYDLADFGAVALSVP